MVKGKQLKPKVPSKKWTKYEVKDGKIERKKYCLKCGPGTFLAIHKDRTHCGKCGFMEKKQI